MKILLDAYFDNNFGDDLFLHILSKRYSDAFFYVFWNKTNCQVLNKLASNPQVVILPGNCIMQEQTCFDAYIMIGGDVLPDGVDYTQRISWMKHVKENGGYVAMLGFSLYREYGEKTIQDIRSMYSLADAVVVRDTFSAGRFRKLVPGARVVDCADMAFAEKDAEGGEYHSSIPVLGISIRRKLYSTEEEHDAYCGGMAEVADAYLSHHKEGRIRFLAFSTGEYDDRITANDIIKKMKTKGLQEIVSYTDSIPDFIQKIRECTALVTTRFHALVFALKFQIPFVPVPYETKLTQLLDEIGYYGERIAYGEPLKKENIPNIIDGLDKTYFDKNKLNMYVKKADAFFVETDKWHTHAKAVCSPNKMPEIFQCDLIMRLDNEKRQNHTEKELLNRQIDELNKWVEALKAERQNFENQNVQLEEVRKNHTEQILELTEQKNNLQCEMEFQSRQKEELLKWIESLKKERREFEQQNIELEHIRLKQEQKLDQLMQDNEKLARNIGLI